MFQGNFGASSTFASDVTSATRLATSAPFARYLAEEIYNQSAWIRSGVMRRSPLLQASVGTRIEAPFFDPINPTEEVITSASNWGTNTSGYFTPQKVTASTQYATITHRGFMFTADDLSKLATGEDPLAHFRSQLAADLAKKRTSKLVSQFEGLFGTALTGNKLNVSATSSPVAANYLNAANITQAKYLLGERAGSINTIAMHSLVAAGLEATGQLVMQTGSTAAGQAVSIGNGGFNASNVGIGQMSGLTVIVDDQMPIVGTGGQSQQFVCYLFGSGVVYEGDQMPLTIETGRNISSLQDAVAVHYHHVQHIPGTSWADSVDNPTNANLATANKWSLAYADRRLVPMVRLQVNAAYGGTI
jgi:AraC-like DNA-binding protein